MVYNEIGENMQNDNIWKSDRKVVIVIILTCIIIQYFTILDIIKIPEKEITFPNTNETLPALEGKIRLLVTWEVCFAITCVTSYELGKLAKKIYWRFHQLAPSKKRQSKK